MATVVQPVWEVYYGQYQAGGDRDVFIISSEGQFEELDVVSRSSVMITEEDRLKLTNQGIPPDCSDDLSIVQARIGLDKTLELVRVEASKPGRELTCGYVLEQIEELLKNSKKPGAVIYYFGNGKRNTGDWCFKDGFITFKDIAKSYMDSFSGRLLTVVTDCSHSGHWVKACAQFLDEQGVRPCGHSAVEKGILLKVYASCRPQQIAATPCFSVRAATNDKNNGVMAYYIGGMKIRETQHTFGANYTQVRCGHKQIEEPCTLSPEFTWQKKSDSERVFLVKGTDRSRPAWHYVLVVDDEATVKTFHEKVASGTVDVAEYGQVLKSGWGKEPPNEVVDELERTYNAVYR